MTVSCLIFNRTCGLLGFSVANGIEISNYRSLSRHAAGEKPSLQAMKLAIFVKNGFITERDVIIYGYNIIVHNLSRFLVNYVHAQTVDTRPLFRGGVWPGDEARHKNNLAYMYMYSA